MKVGAIENPALVVQERRRLYREALTISLRSELDGVVVLEGVADVDELKVVAASFALSYAVIEADGVPWDVDRLADELRARQPDLCVVGLSRRRKPQKDGICYISPLVAPLAIADLVQPGRERVAPFVVTATERGMSHANSGFSDQQIKVLAILSLGLSVREAAARLGMTEVSVSRCKAAVFAKLGVQTQAQAIAKASSAGLLGPPCAK